MTVHRSSGWFAGELRVFSARRRSLRQPGSVGVLRVEWSGAHFHLSSSRFVVVEQVSRAVRVRAIKPRTSSRRRPVEHWRLLALICDAIGIGSGSDVIRQC